MITTAEEPPASRPEREVAAAVGTLREHLRLGDFVVTSELLHAYPGAAWSRVEFVRRARLDEPSASWTHLAVATATELGTSGPVLTVPSVDPSVEGTRDLVGSSLSYGLLPGGSGRSEAPLPFASNRAFYELLALASTPDGARAVLAIGLAGRRAPSATLRPRASSVEVAAEVAVLTAVASGAPLEWALRHHGAGPS